MANEIWTIKRCLEWTKEYLAERGEEHPRLSAEWLLCAATGLARIDLYMRMDETLNAAQLETMHAAVVREPLQYITGSTQFRMIDVACAPGVLIPRPETEMLVEEVLNYLDAEVLSPEAATRQRAELPWNDEVEQARKAEAALADERATAERRAENLTAADEAALGGDVLGSRAYAEELADREAEEAAAQAEEAEAAEAEELAEPELDEYGIAIEGADQEAAPVRDAAAPAPVESRIARVLEVGCGTGCISLSLAWERRGHVTCTATDIEPRAIDLATKNRDALGLTADEVAFSLTNLVSSIPHDEWGTFDVLVSNPPYIPTDVMRSLPHEVKDFEPDLALEGGADGLDIFRRLLNAAPYMLRAGGLFASELYEGALDAAAELCRQAGLSDVRIVHDLTDRPRIVRAIVTEPKQRQ